MLLGTGGESLHEFIGYKPPYIAASQDMLYGFLNLKFTAVIHIRYRYIFIPTTVLIAIPLPIHTYLVFAVGYFGSKKLKIPYAEAAPTAFIGASNFFELAVAVSTILFGVHSGVTLAITVGVLVEVPVMLSLVQIMIRKKAKFQFNVSKHSNNF